MWFKWYFFSEPHTWTIFGWSFNMGIQTKFEETATSVKEWNPTKGTPSNEEKLKLYSLYKQATVGDVTGSQPWAGNKD